jgi:tetratricopeptide (TPR) repeat protein
LFRELEDVQGTAQALLMLGALQHTQGRYENARPTLLEALDTARASQQTALIPQILRELGRGANDRGDFDAAQRYAEEALTLYEQLGDRAGIASAYNELGIIAGRRNNDTASKEYYLKAYEINRLLGLKTAMAIALVNSGIATKKVGQYDEAIDIYRRSHALFEEIGHPMGIAVSLVNAGNAHMLLGNDEAAQNVYLEALGPAQQAKAWAVIAGGILVGMARLAAKAGDKARAIEYYTLTINHTATSVNNREDATKERDEIGAQMLPEEYARLIDAARPIEEVVAALEEQEKRNEHEHGK